MAPERPTEPVDGSCPDRPAPFRRGGEFDSVSTPDSRPGHPYPTPRRGAPGAAPMTATASESDETLTDSAFARWLRLLKLLLTVLTLFVSLVKALGVV